MDDPVPAPERFSDEGTLRLSDIVERLGALDPGQPVEICVDELVIDASVALSLRDLRVHARVATCPLPARIALDTDAESATWQLLFGHLEGEAAAALELRCMGLRLPFEPLSPAFQGFRATWSAGERGGELRVDEIGALAGDPLVLTDILLQARRQRATQPEQALERARWVVAASAAAPGQARLFAQAVQLLSHLSSPQRGFHLVPYLDRGLYVQQAEALLAALEAVDADLRVVDDRGYDIDARRATAEGLLGRIGHAAELTQKLLDQSSENLKAAQGELEQAGRRLTTQHAATDAAKTRFDEGLAEWRRGQIIGAVFKAILGIGIAVAAICSANPAAAGAGIGTAATAVKEAGDAAERIRKIIELLKKIKETVEESQALKQLIDGINKIREAIAAGQAATALVDRVHRGWEQMPTGGQSMRPEDWDELALELAAVLESAIGAGVPGAAAYRQEMQKLVVRGKANFFAEAHVIESAQRYAAMLWTLERDRADSASLRAEIDEIQAGAPVQQRLRLRFEHARDDIRSRVVLAIENIADAHRYFALAEAAVAADPSMSTAGLRAALGRAADDLVQAYERFDPRPQRWNDRLRIELTEERRQALQTSGALTVSLPMVPESFRNYMRVRVAQVKAFFMGARCPAGEDIQLEIATGDHYRDRYETPMLRQFDFAGRPVRLGFAYRHRDGVSMLPLDGDPEASVEVSLGGERMDEWDVFFEPTPFTEWQIRLPRAGNEHLDLGTCRCIDLYLRGSAVLGGFRAMLPEAALGAPAEGQRDLEPATPGSLIAAAEFGIDPGQAARRGGADD